MSVSLARRLIAHDGSVRCRLSPPAAVHPSLVLWSRRRRCLSLADGQFRRGGISGTTSSVRHGSWRGGPTTTSNSSRGISDQTVLRRLSTESVRA
jgi:hypothetical protein